MNSFYLSLLHWVLFQGLGSKKGAIAYAKIAPIIELVATEQDVTAA